MLGVMGKLGRTLFFGKESRLLVFPANSFITSKKSVEFPTKSVDCCDRKPEEEQINIALAIRV